MLSFDGKLVTQGSFGEKNGDVDLWGKEGVITVCQALKQRDKLIDSVSSLENPITHHTLQSHLYKVRTMTCNISNQICKLRHQCKSDFFNQQKLFKLVENNPNMCLSLRKTISHVNTNIADCENIIHRALDVNYELCKEISRGNGHLNVFSNNKTVCLMNQPNTFTLLPHELRQTTEDDNTLTDSLYMKQGLDDWYTLHSQAKITGSTFGKAIGLDGLKKQKEHHYEYMLGKKPAPPNDHLQAMFDHSKKFEVHALATLVGAIMPALLPPCYSFFEIGSLVEYSENDSPFLVVSPDGILECIQGSTCCEFTSITHHGRIMVECKSPFPHDDLPEEPYYEVPVCHVPQLLADMALFKALELWLLCCTLTSVTLIIVSFDAQLWKKITVSRN